MDEMSLHRRPLAVQRVLARGMEMELLQFVLAPRRRVEAAGRGVRLDRVPVVDDAERLGPPRYGWRLDLGPDSASQINRRLLAADGASRKRTVRAPIRRIGVAPMRAFGACDAPLSGPWRGISGPRRFPSTQARGRASPTRSAGLVQAPDGAGAKFDLGRHP